MNKYHNFRNLVFTFLIGHNCASVYSLPTNIALNKFSSTGTSIFSNPQNALDGNLATVSGGGSDRTGGGAIGIDFGAPKNLGRLKITFGNANRPAQKYKIQVSTDGKIWTDYLRVFNPITPVDDRELPPGVWQYARYVAMLDHADVSSGEASWTMADISEIEIFERESGESVAAPVSYPPALDRSNWKVTCSSGDAADATISNPDQGWFDTHGGGFFGPPDLLIKKTPNAGDWFKIDLGSKQTFNQLYALGEHSDFEDFDLFVSDDDKTWGTAIATGSLVDLGGNRLPISFPTQTKQYIKIVRLESGDGWWGARNFSVHNTTGTTLIDSSDTVNIALHKTVISKKNDAALLVDGDDNTGTNPDTLTLDLGSIQKIAKINLKIAPLQTGLWFGIETSDDGIKWTLKQRSFLGTESKRVHSGVVFANYSARYLRFNFPIQDYNGKWVFVSFREIEVYKPRAGGAATALSPRQKKGLKLVEKLTSRLAYKVNGQSLKVKQ